MYELLNTKVLVLEDDPVLLRTLERQLSQLGCDVTLTANATEFMTAFFENSASIDLVIVDIHLPGMNGDVLISWLRESESKAVQMMPVLIITGRPQDIPEDIFLDGPTLSVLPKPFTMAQLRKDIANLTRGQQIH